MDARPGGASEVGADAGAPLLAFSWGYEGWGNHTRALVELVDAVEAARGFAPPTFVDVRLRRQVRAVGFRERAFEALLGERYRWLRGLGNLAVSGASDVMALADPGEAATLLAIVEAGAARRSRVIFFCACGSPHARATCHRGMVTTALLAAARRREAALAVHEWPGGAPIIGDVAVSAAQARKLRAVAGGAGRTRLPLPAGVALARAGGLPHYSLVRCAAEGEAACLAVSGAAIRTPQGWMLPVHAVLADADARAAARRLDGELRDDALLPFGARLALPPRWRVEPLAGDAPP